MSFDDVEYRRSNAAVSSGAITAWEAGADGAGVKVAVIDSGINPSLAEFAGRIDPASQDVAADRGIVDQEGHGTGVTGVIAAARNGSGFEGVAFAATIISLNTADPTDCDPDDGCSHSDTDIARALDLARTNGARVVNISLGGEAPAPNLVAALDRAVTAGLVVVVSAGNEGGTTPDQFAAGLAQAGGGNVLIAGAMTNARNLASFSNRAGGLTSAYIVALGEDVRSIDQNGTATLWSGTSFSAPVVSGAAALLASAFPNLTGAEIVEILLGTADDAGAPGADAVFGSGILNIARAFAPQGAMRVAGTGAPIEGLGAGEGSEAMGDARPQMQGVIVLDGYSRAYAVNLANTMARAPQQRPLSQGLQAGLATAQGRAGPAMVSITVRHDLFGQPEIGMAQAGMTYENVRQARALAGYALSRLGPRTAFALGFSESGRTLQQRLSDQPGAPFLVARDPLARAGFFADSGVSIGARHDMGLFALTVTGERGEVDLPYLRRGLRAPGYALSTVSADRRIGPANLSIGISRLTEDGTVLGGRFAFAPGGAATWFADASIRTELGDGWSMAASYRRGWTTMAGTGALVAGGELSTDAWSADLMRASALVPGDRFAIRLMQPLRVRSGGYEMNLPVSYDYETLAPGYALRLFSLAPTGREIDAEAAWSLPVLDGAGWLGLNAYYRHDPGHIDGYPADLGAAVRLSLGF